VRHQLKGKGHRIALVVHDDNGGVRVRAMEYLKATGVSESLDVTAGPL